MANNRMWLVHRPTGRRVLLGKRMAWGWYLQPGGYDVRDELQGLFDAVELAEADQDDFVLEMEEPDQDDFVLEMEEPGPSAHPMSRKYGDEGRGEGDQH